jgi:hypothetical protein
MDINDNIDSPLELKISFKKLLEQYEVLTKSEDELVSAKAKSVLSLANEYPVLKEGFSDISILKTREKEIQTLLHDTFSPLLTKNEIKTASVPFHNLFFNASDRFKNIIENAGDDFELQIKNLPEDDTYIVACAIILQFCYGFNLNFKRPFYYDIPDANGILRHYKILYNADFCEITPTEKSKKITQADFNELLDNFDNIELWKDKFPPNSYEFNGFVISNIFEVTDDQCISNIKSSLLADKKGKDESSMEEFHNIFRSLFGIPDIKVGVSIYNNDEGNFTKAYGSEVSSYLLGAALESGKCAEALCEWSYNRLIKENKYVTISDVDGLLAKSKNCAPQISSLHKQGIKSAILAPIANEEGLMGILEIVSQKPFVLNSVNANKLIDVMPYIVSSVERTKSEEENLIEAIIQKECTSIHPSVKWRFAKEAKEFIISEMNGLEPSFKPIVFDKVFPLYGQIDIKGSSDARNQATKLDLALQLNAAKRIIQNATTISALPIYEKFIYQINDYLNDLNTQFQVDSEQQILEFFSEEIEPVFTHVRAENILRDEIDAYFYSINGKVKSLYKHRKEYDDAIALINKEMARFLDEKQEGAQAMYPHFFERFKTDGVEHNMYIGESLTKEDSFNPIFLYNLRLWQLQVMCEMENAYYQMQSDFPIQLDVASMILVFSQPLSISFRMDEKQFDVDGTYNARYEIVKKRVDKAFIKGTKKRITEKGKITIVYSQKQDEREYLGYVKFLQSKHYLDTDVEILELQDLQAVTGLKAIRVSVLYHKDKEDKAFYTYDDLMKEIKN